jgi:hypothetical protein
MFIVYGSYNREKDYGVVADRCIHCTRVAMMGVKRFYRVPHIYFIPLGSGTLAATVLTCAECNGQTLGKEELYRKVLPKAATHGLSTEQVVEETNPQLHEELVYRANLLQQARNVIGASPATPSVEHGIAERADMIPMEIDPTPRASVNARMPDPRVELAFARLANLDFRSQDVAQLQMRLAQWHALDTAAQAQLLRDIDRVADEQDQANAALRFVFLMAQKFTPDVDAGLAVLVLAVIAVIGVALTLTLFMDSPYLVAGGLFISLAGAVAASVWCYRAQTRRSHRKFFQTTFLPDAHHQDVSVVRVIKLLKEPPPTIAHEPVVQKLAEALPMLDEVLKGANTEGEVADAVAALAANYPRTRFRKRINWIVPAVLVGVIAMIVGVIWWVAVVENEQKRAEQERRIAFAAPFQAHLAEYLPAAPQRDLQQPYRRGKVVPINLGAKGIDAMLVELPPPIRPDKPEDVGMIVWLHWRTEVVGRYTDGVDAHMVKCNVTLIDKQLGIIIAEQEFTGSQPPQRRQNPGDPNIGSTPNHEVMNWLLNLPVKQ